MGEFLWQGVEWLLRVTGIHALARKLFHRFSVELADRFSTYSRRVLILSFFIAFVVTSGSLREGWRNIVQAYWPDPSKAESAQAYFLTLSGVLYRNGPTILPTNGFATNFIVDAFPTNLIEPGALAGAESNGICHFFYTNDSWFLQETNGSHVLITRLVKGQTNDFLGGMGRMMADIKTLTWARAIKQSAWILFTFFVSAVMAFVISLLITTIADNVAARLRQELNPPDDKPEMQAAETGQRPAPVAGPPNPEPSGAAARAKLLVEILKESGVEAVYGALQRKEVNEQEYAPDIVAKVKIAKSVRLLTIAGYEYIGKGEDSLLYHAISTGTKNLEVILLDPVKGEDAIRDRIENLKERDATYTAEKLVSNINDTRKMLSVLKHEKRKNVALYYTPTHPVFRVLMTETCLFFSTYSNTHGHETPVYFVTKATGNSDCSSWYTAFELLFNNARHAAEKVKDL